MHFLVLQHIECEHPGIFRDLMKSGGTTWDAVELDEGESIPDFAGYDVMLVMGGPMDVWQTKEHPWLAGEIAAIERWVRAGKPYLGFCLGHQLLAEALGGKTGPAAQPEIGVMPVSLTAAGKVHWFFKDCPPHFETLQWHSAEVLQTPADAEILAASPACGVNAMGWGDCAVSVQFHVEITERTVGDWGEIPEYASALEAALGQGALARINQSAARNMPDFNRLSETLYRNFTAQIRQSRKGKN
ncbi:MAG: type 1 glutamine amidotransferase [Gammaproteobacteria bacterium]